MAARIPPLMRPEQNLAMLQGLDKVFAAEWVDNGTICFGTKCNKLIVQDLLGKQNRDPSGRDKETRCSSATRREWHTHNVRKSPLRRTLNISKRLVMSPYFTLSCSNEGL